MAVQKSKVSKKIKSRQFYNFIKTKIQNKNGLSKLKKFSKKINLLKKNYKLI